MKAIGKEGSRIREKRKRRMEKFWKARREENVEGREAEREENNFEEECAI